MAAPLRCSKTHAGRRQAAPLAQRSEFLPSLAAPSAVVPAAPKPNDNGLVVARIAASAMREWPSIRLQGPASPKRDAGYVSYE
jgi:hypothetical protein